MFNPSDKPQAITPDTEEVKQDPFFLLREVAIPCAKTTFEDGIAAFQKMLSREKTVQAFANLSMAARYSPSDDVY